jgi:serine/threonine protein kinase
VILPRTVDVSNTDEPDKPPPPPPDPGATVILSEEEVERLREQSTETASAQPTDPLLGTLIRDKWRVLARLGAGSFGTVYKVRDVTGGWVEALKILSVDRLTGAEADEMRARFLREAQIMKRLGKESRHIVGLSTYEEDIAAGLVYFLMEFVEGHSLAAALEADGPFEPDRVVRLALQVCDALMVAHEGPEPVVHRDLKLENLMLTKDRAGEDVVKVLDFGIAKIAERDVDSRLTTAGTLGTPGYAAPEQLRAEAVDARTDLFSFGVILYALLTGRDPWLGHPAHEPTNQIYELMVATERGEARPLGAAGGSVPPALAAVVMRLLRRDPTERFQSARDLRDALDGLPAASTEHPAPAPAPAPAPRPAATRPTAPRPPTPGPRPRPRPKRRRRTGRLLVLIAAAGATGAAAWARPWGRTLDVEGLMAAVTAESISAVWFNDAGVEGGLRIVPIEAAAGALVPFSVAVPIDERLGLVRGLRDEGIDVDVSWEIRRVLDLAAQAQARGRYFDGQGTDVRTHALHLAELEPGSVEAAALLRKVGERMAWDASSAFVEGDPERARTLVRSCLDLVEDHPRCLEVSTTLP